MTTEAWVIHKYWSGDTSARVVFFTRDQGLVTCLYKGGRTPKKQALLQPFTPLWLVMDSRREIHYVRHLEVTAAPIQLCGHNLFSGLYVNELIYHALKPLDPHSALYTAYIHTLQTLMLASDRLMVESVLRRFEWALLTECGYHMSLTQDALTDEPIKVNSDYQFIAGKGFVLAEKGFSGAHIIAMSQDRLDDATVLSTAKRIMRQAIDHALEGKEIKARALYKS